ncbi:nucleotide exchange factor GrpE [Brasilonema octagenarum]|uniref:Nucleotide exchange factor GrpE n=1 Tax=Brasilonema octagenarum UFV-OR1 TaxID=417115 RepID=A0ABX1M8C1_9CYAN|nr:nucleotide exchange factor GrpE [Brasilonema octagenarum]NMF63781.1 nucleotide exchange factor GrpE [Brasilonema octagenarum UFV-OR1]
MSFSHNNNKDFQELEKILQNLLNDNLQSYLDNLLKNNLEKSIKESLNEYVSEQIKIQRASYTNTNAILDNTAAIKELNEKLEYTLAELNDFKNSVENMLVEQRQKNGELQRKINYWEQSAIEFFRLLERAVDYETDEHKLLINRILDGYNGIFMNLGMERIIPQEKESLSEKFHEAIDEEESDIIPGNIVRCISWGYKIGDKVLEKAKVVVAK